MSLLKEHIEYLKNNPEGYWFKRKLYGWGWTPATWQGWLVLAVFIILITLNAFRIDFNSHSASDTLINFISQTIILGALFIWICLKKAERPRWQWGLRDEEKKN